MGMPADPQGFVAAAGEDGPGRSTDSHRPDQLDPLIAALGRAVRRAARTDGPGPGSGTTG
jgi:hypothetical protein